MAISLEELNKLYPDYDILPQTMPPFPWHQGGRSYHNVLTKKIKFQISLRMYLIIFVLMYRIAHFRAGILKKTFYNI